MKKEDCMRYKTVGTRERYLIFVWIFKHNFPDDIVLKYLKNVAYIE